METKVRRDFKNPVFIDMFERDDYRLEMFRTFHPEMDDVTAEDIQTVTLKLPQPRGTEGIPARRGKGGHRHHGHAL